MSTHHSLINPTHDTTLQKFLTSEYTHLNTSLLTDVTLHTPTTIFKAHRIVLSHYSRFFTTIFNSSPSTTHDIYLEGFTAPDIERALTFMYTGTVVWGPDVTLDKGSLADVAESLEITLLSKFLRDGGSSGEMGVKGDESPRNGESPVSVWQKCEDFEDDGGIEFEEQEVEEEEEIEDEYEYYEERSKGKGSGGEEGSGSIGGVSKRRKQARPQRHKPTPPPSRSNSPTDIPSLPSSPEDPSQNSYDEDSRDHPQPKTPPQISPQPHHQPQNQHIPLPLNPQSPLHNLPQPPPHYLFLRSIMNQTQIPPPHTTVSPHHPPPHPHFYPHAPLKKMQVTGPKGLWGKLMSKGPGGGGGFTHGSSRAQHSAPRGGPPRAWSNQDLTEALHNVWNKKMTTSQASRIFGIPYNSLLMYVRGKYGKSLKLDLLKKGLDLALLEKQKKAAMQAQEQRSGQQNGQSQQASPSSSSTRENPGHQGWGTKIADGRDRTGERGGLFHAGLYYGGGGREQEIGK